MSFAQLLAILRARWPIAVGVFTLVFGTVAAFTWLMPKTYTAVGSVLVDVKSPDPIAGVVPQAVMTPSFLMTQVDVISSSRVSHRVVSNLKLTDVPSLRAKWLDHTGGTGSFDGYVAAMIRANLEARPSRGSNVINLQYQASDPAFAAAIVNAYIGAYMDISMEMRTDPAKRYGTFFDSSAKQLRDKLEEAQNKLSAFQQKSGIVVTDERLDVEMSRLNELSQSYVGMQTAVADSESRRVQVNAQARNTQEVMSSPLVTSLKQDVVRLEANLTQLQTRMGDQHPTVIEARANVEESRRKLDAEIRRVSTSYNVSNVINVNRAAQVKASLEEQRAKVLKMKQLRDEAAMLQRDVDYAQHAYDGVMQRRNLTSLEAQAQQNNIMPLEYAPVPSLPTSPRVFTNLFLGALGGLLLSALVSLVVERSDRRLRTVSEVEGLFHVPVVGTVPSFRKQLAHESSSRFRISLPRLKAAWR
ncbi:MAG: chain length determinant protein EpsF [Pseudomonadota bacterium]